MTYVMVDVETDEPIPADYSMICFGAVIVDEHFLGDNPFGHSSTNLGSLYKGLVRDMTSDFKYLRKTAHTHHPLDDALGNAEALLYMKKKMRLKIDV